MFFYFYFDQSQKNTWVCRIKKHSTMQGVARVIEYEVRLNYNFALNSFLS